jgi:hypothetical protein
MNARKPDKLRRQIAEMRRSPRQSVELERVAGQLGRKLVKRGKEPTWENENFPTLRPLSIPDHPGDLANGTKNAILTQLDDDIIAWDDQLSNSG